MAYAAPGTPDIFTRSLSIKTRPRSYEEAPKERNSRPTSPRISELPRSASSVHLSSLDNPNELALSFSEDDLIPSSTWQSEATYPSSGPSSPETEVTVPRNPQGSSSGDSGSRPPLPKILIAAGKSSKRPEKALTWNSPASGKTSQKTQRLSRTISGLSRKTKRPPAVITDPDVGQSTWSSDAPALSSDITPTSGDQSQEEATSDKNLTTRTMRGSSRKPKGSIRSGLNLQSIDGVKSNVRMTSPLHKSFSSDSLPISGAFDSKGEKIPPVPCPVSSEKLHISALQPSRKKDELWNVFRSLDGEFQKFQSKSIALKANVIRASLLPFLRTYGTHHSNKDLRPEDLDRRTTILNKWWTGLIDMLKGRNNASISGTDRPAVLEGVCGIMERPEWRTPSSPFSPIVDRYSSDYGRKSRYTSDVQTTPNFLQESIQRNVANLFIENLLSQVVVTVDKMSLKSAPASLIEFCGKTCAYAFMFCPGVAEILVRLWDIPSSLLKRVLDGWNISKTASFQDTSEAIARDFPPCLWSLRFISFRQTLNGLKKEPTLPNGTDAIQWFGYWLSRWSGKESDLFFVFVRHYHLLVVDFLPSALTKAERICVPGLLLIHAQLLARLELMIHLPVKQNQAEVSIDPSLTFDDLLGPDASEAPIPAPPMISNRFKSENRIIMLLREFLSDKISDSSTRRLFADNFANNLNAVVRSTSLYDHNACFSLCDFLEEALVLLARYEIDTLLEQRVLDMNFWIDVFQKMVESHNTMTEIRLYAFLYTIWDSITIREPWKAAICLGFLLDVHHFESRFNHWCPMVRAYYMRLLCWRIARLDEDASDLDIRTLETLMSRLKSVHSHYSYLTKKAQQEGTICPSTVPCNPAPGRRLLIMRTDTITPSSFMSFNTIRPFSAASASIPGRYQIASRPVPVISAGPSPNQLHKHLSSSPDRSADLIQKKGRSLRSFLGYRSSEPHLEISSPLPSSQDLSTPSSKRSSKNPSPERPSALSPSGTSDGPSGSPIDHSTSHSIPDRSNNSTPRNEYSGPASFKFSLEMIDKRTNTLLPPVNLQPPRLPLTAQLFLQAQPGYVSDVAAAEPTGAVGASSIYAGRALAEWTLVVNEFQNFFERRKKEGVPRNKLVETPNLMVEPFRRPN